MRNKYTRITRAVKLIRKFQASSHLTPEQLAATGKALEALKSIDKSVRLPPTAFTPGQVADMFNVSPVTVRAWESEGKLKAHRTPGGHRRFNPRDVRMVMRRMTA